VRVNSESLTNLNLYFKVATDWTTITIIVVVVKKVFSVDFENIFRSNYLILEEYFYYTINEITI
jgi:hypothetical protein